MRNFDSSTYQLYWEYALFSLSVKLEWWFFSVGEYEF